MEDNKGAIVLANNKQVSRDFTSRGSLLCETRRLKSKGPYDNPPSIGTNSIIVKIFKSNHEVEFDEVMPRLEVQKYGDGGTITPPRQKIRRTMRKTKHLSLRGKYRPQHRPVAIILTFHSYL